MSKKSPSSTIMGSSGTASSEFNVNVPCFPSPAFSSQSHLRHVLPQIPTRAGYPRMAVSKASTRDVLLGRMFEGESFADVITTHKLDDSLEQVHTTTKDARKSSDHTKGERHKPASTGGVKRVSEEEHVYASVEGDMKGWRPSSWDDDADHESVQFTRSYSPSHLLNVGDTTKNCTTLKSSAGGEFARFGQKEGKDFSPLDDVESDYLTNSSKTLKQSKQSGAVDSMLFLRSTYSGKSRSPRKSPLLTLFDESDSDDDSPVAMNLSLASKSPLKSGAPATAASLPKFPSGTQHQDARRDDFGGSPLDAIMKMTHMINTSKNQPSTFTEDQDIIIPVGSFPQQFATTMAPFQPGDAWSKDTRIFGSGTSPGTTYRKIAAEGMLGLPGSVKVSGQSDGGQARSDNGKFVRSPTGSRSQTTDSQWDAACRLKSAKQTFMDTSAETHEDGARSQVSDGSPIKLKIRRGTTGDNSQLSVITSKQSKDAKPHDVMLRSGESTQGHPCLVSQSLLGAALTPGLAPAGTAKSKLLAPGRAKTKGELKKQLFERKEQRLRTDGSQASSPAGSTMTPSPSHADTLSPLTVNVDGGSLTPQPSPLLSSGKTSVATVVSPTGKVNMACLFLCLNITILQVYCLRVLYTVSQKT